MQTVAGIILCDGEAEYYAADVPEALVQTWSKTSEHILGVAALVARHTCEPRSASRKAISFVDNDAVKKFFDPLYF